MTNKIKIGETIQDFRLRDQKREEVHLYDQKGKKSPPVISPACLDTGLRTADEIT